MRRKPRPAGNGKKEVNVYFSSSVPEQSRLSHLAPSPILFSLGLEDLKLLGFFPNELELLADENAVLLKEGASLLRIEQSALESMIAQGGLNLAVKSVEGFLHSLKVYEWERQKELCLLAGHPAYQRGKRLPKLLYEDTRAAFLLGAAFPFQSPEHRALLEWCLHVKFTQHEESRKALDWTGDAGFVHKTRRKRQKKAGSLTSMPRQVLFRTLAECRRIIRGRQAALTFSDVLDRNRRDALDELQYYESSGCWKNDNAA